MPPSVSRPWAYRNLPQNFAFIGEEGDEALVFHELLDFGKTLRFSLFFFSKCALVRLGAFWERRESRNGRQEEEKQKSNRFNFQSCFSNGGRGSTVDSVHVA